MNLYRSVLLKTEQKAPYILVAHSIAGIYATYWAKERTLEKIEKSLEQSMCFAVFDMESNQIIGFAN